jgi:hypothetical protein
MALAFAAEFPAFLTELQMVPAAETKATAPAMRATISSTLMRFSLLLPVAHDLHLSDVVVVRSQYDTT